MDENIEDNEYIAEFGSSNPISFCDAKLYDMSDNEIVIPKCEKCGSYKSMLIGKESFQWICTVC